MNEKDYERKYYASLLSCNNEKKFHELLMNNDFTGNNEGQVLKCPESEKKEPEEVPIGTMMPNYEDGSIYAKTDKGWINLNDSLSAKEVIADVPRGTLSNSDEEIKIALPAGDENKFYQSLKEGDFSISVESSLSPLTDVNGNIVGLVTRPDKEIKADWQDFDISEVENSELLRTREKLTKLENSAIKAFAGFEISYQRFVVLLVCAKISKLVMEKGRSLAPAISKIAKFSIRNVSEHLHLLSENGYLEKADLKVQDKVIWGYNLTKKGEKILDLGLIIWRKINVTDHL